MMHYLPYIVASAVLIGIAIWLCRDPRAVLVGFLIAAATVSACFVAWLLLLMFVPEAHAGTELRFCPNIKRDANGRIARSAAAVAEFRRNHPCPATGRISGPCKGWSIDHVIPLASCGCDAPFNMQWLPNRIKSCAGAHCKDRWERRVYTCPQVSQP